MTPAGTFINLLMTPSASPPVIGLRGSCYFSMSATNAGSFIVSLNALRMIATPIGRDLLRHDERAADYVGAVQHVEKLLLLVGLGEGVDEDGALRDFRRFFPQKRTKGWALPSLIHSTGMLL